MVDKEMVSLEKKLRSGGNMLRRLVWVGILAVFLAVKPCVAVAAGPENVLPVLPNERVLVFKKSAHTLTVYKEGKAVKAQRGK